MSDDARGTASKHSTRQEVQKLPHTTCGRCGLTGVSTMVREGLCLNSAACGRRQRQNALKRKVVAAPPKAEPVSGSRAVSNSNVVSKADTEIISPELQALLAQMDAEMEADVAKEKAEKAKKRRKQR